MLLLTFTAGANRYAINVARVVEVVPRVDLRKIAHAPAYLAGLLGYRGKVVPVIDLGLLLDAGPCRDCLSTRIILVNDSPDVRESLRRDRAHMGDDAGEERVIRKQNPSLLGLIAECVSELTDIRPERLVPVPAWLPHAPYLGDTVQTDQGIVQLIVVEKMRELSLRSFDLSQDEALESISET
jgi:chemotaxis-related protein WspB